MIISFEKSLNLSSNPSGKHDTSQQQKTILCLKFGFLSNILSVQKPLWKFTCFKFVKPWKILGKAFHSAVSPSSLSSAVKVSQLYVCKTHEYKYMMTHHTVFVHKTCKKINMLLFNAKFLLEKLLAMLQLVEGDVVVEVVDETLVVEMDFALELLAVVVLDLLGVVALAAELLGVVVLAAELLGVVVVLAAELLGVVVLAAELLGVEVLAAELLGVVVLAGMDLLELVLAGLGLFQLLLLEPLSRREVLAVIHSASR